MLNVLLTGVGGQGTVLAAKVLAQAAHEKGWSVKTAETIGMAQRGGSVISHVRIGNRGEAIYQPLVVQGTADLIVAFEPAEAARVLSFLAPEGLLVTATTAVIPSATAFSKENYQGDRVLAHLKKVAPNFIAVDDALLCEKLGSSKALNVMLLAKALQALGGKQEKNEKMTIDDLKKALNSCVKSQFIEMNLRAVDIATEQ